MELLIQLNFRSQTLTFLKIDSKRKTISSFNNSWLNSDFNHQLFFFNGMQLRLQPETLFAQWNFEKRLCFDTNYTFTCPTGFTFSFPMVHHSIHSGILVNWTKSFKCTGVEGKDVVQLLNKALIKKGCYNVTVNAILNDTTGKNSKN